MTIRDDEFKKAVLLGLQVCSTHLCALALGAKVPNSNYGKPLRNLEEVSKQGAGASKAMDKRQYVPLGHTEQVYHAGAQQQFNMMIDDLVGTAEEEEALKPHVVPPPAGDNVTPIKGE